MAANTRRKSLKSSLNCFKSEDESTPIGANQSPLSPSTSQEVGAKKQSKSRKCQCCDAKIRQSFRKSKCHGCQKKVCKKCRVVKKLCHKCVARQRVVSVKELLKMDCERLVTLLEQVHCEHGTIQAVKNDGDAMVRQLLTICDMKNTLMEFEKALTSAEHANNRRNEAPQNKSKPVKRCDLGQLIKQRLVNEVEAEVVIDSGRHSYDVTEANATKDIELLAIPQTEQIRKMAPPIPTPTGYCFFVNEDHKIPDDVIGADSTMANQQLQTESMEIELREFRLSATPNYVTPAQSAHKSQLENLNVNQSPAATVDDSPTAEVDMRQKAVERKSTLNDPHFNRIVEDLTVIKSADEIRQLRPFQLKTILQKRGRPITGLIEFEDFVMKVISVWEEEKVVKEERLQQELEEEKRRMAEKKRRMEEENARIEERLLEEKKRRMEEDIEIEEYEQLVNEMEETEVAVDDVEVAVDDVEMAVDDVEMAVDDVERLSDDEEAEVSVKEQLEMDDDLQDMDEVVHPTSQIIQHLTMTSYDVPETVELSDDSSSSDSDEAQEPSTPPTTVTGLVEETAATEVEHRTEETDSTEHNSSSSTLHSPSVQLENAAHSTEFCSTLNSAPEIIVVQTNQIQIAISEEETESRSTLTVSTTTSDDHQSHVDPTKGQENASIGSSEENSQQIARTIAQNSSEVDDESAKQLSETVEKTPIDISKVISIDDIRSETDIDNLSIAQMKTLLTNSSVNYKDLMDRHEFVAKLKDVWKSNQNQLKEGSEEGRCKICLSCPVNTVFLECGHMVACQECASHIKECPICRFYITRVVRVFH